MTPYIRIVLLAGLMAFSAMAVPARADQVGARYAERVMNGYNIENGSVLAGAWVSSFPTPVGDYDVNHRARPEYQPKGMPLGGGFRLFPTLSLDGGYTDNVYYTQASPRADEYWDVNSAVSLQSDWGRSSVAVYGGALWRGYSKYSSEDQVNPDGGMAARIDLADGADVRVNAFYDENHEARTSPDQSVGAIRPTQYGVMHYDTSFDYKPNRFGVTVGGSLDNYAYSATPVLNGPTIDNTDRNENIYAGFGRVTYDFAPGFTGFVGASYDAHDFSHRLDRNGLDRTSAATTAITGLELFISDMIQGQVYGGYLHQDFHAPFHSISTGTYGATLNWYVTPLLNLHTGVERNIDDTVIDKASSADNRVYYVSFDYELLTDLIVRGQGNFSQSTFLGATRRDETLGGGVQVAWLLNRLFEVDLGYQYGHRNTDATDEKYSANTVELTLKSHL